MRTSRRGAGRSRRPWCPAPPALRPAAETGPQGTRRGSIPPAPPCRPLPDLRKGRARYPTRRRGGGPPRRTPCTARSGVDVGGADEALQQLVGGIVILGQQRARDIHRHHIRSVFRGGVGKPPRHQVKRPAPACIMPPDPGWVSRRPFIRPMVSPRALPLMQSRPRRPGWSGSPATDRPPTPPRVAKDTADHPATKTGDAGWRGGGLIGQGRSLQAAALRRIRPASIRIRPSCTLTGQVRTMPSSAPWAWPVFMSKTQLCSGQVTDVP